MDKKRKKKSKGRNKLLRKEASPEEATPAIEARMQADPDGAEADPVRQNGESDEVEGAPDESGGAPDESEGARVATGEDGGGDAQPVDAVIDLEEDLDDPIARAELVAAVAGLEAPPDPERDDAPPREDVADAPVDVPPEEPATHVEGAAVASPDADYGAAPDSSDESEDAPIIRADALAALREFRREGVATLPEELILDLGEATTPEERDRLLAAALAHVEMQDAIYRVPLESGASRRWKGVIATAVFVVAMMLAGLPPAFLVPDPTPPLTATERAGGIRMALLMQAEQIEAFRARSGRLPSSVAEVENTVPGIRFVRSSNRVYQLIAYTPDGNAVVYDSASPDPSFAPTEEVWARVKGDS
ncbi:MAG: hypothetical protein HKO77_07315 [Gemmatimonadetes bacterium]|nr:hypothetical protein [Gemmatimonadota bacterium]